MYYTSVCLINITIFTYVTGHLHVLHKCRSHQYHDLYIRDRTLTCTTQVSVSSISRSLHTSQDTYMYYTSVRLINITIFTYVTGHLHVLHKCPSHQYHDLYIRDRTLTCTTQVSVSSISRSLHT